MSVCLLINNVANPLISGACYVKREVKLAKLLFLPLLFKKNILLSLQTVVGLMHLPSLRKHLFSFSWGLKVCWPCFLSNRAEAADRDCCCWFSRFAIYAISYLIFLYKASQIIDLFGLMSWRRLTMKQTRKNILQ